MKICIYGAGAVGGLIAAWLARSGHEVSVVARGRQLEAIREHGLLPAGGALLEKPFTAHQLAERVHETLARTET